MCGLEKLCCDEYVWLFLGYPLANHHVWQVYFIWLCWFSYHAKCHPHLSNLINKNLSVKKKHTEQELWKPWQYTIRIWTSRNHLPSISCPRQYVRHPPAKIAGEMTLTWCKARVLGWFLHLVIGFSPQKKKYIHTNMNCKVYIYACLYRRSNLAENFLGVCSWPARLDTQTQNKGRTLTRFGRNHSYST